MDGTPAASHWVMEESLTERLHLQSVSRVRETYKVWCYTLSLVTATSHYFPLADGPQEGPVAGNAERKAGEVHKIETVAFRRRKEPTYHDLMER